MMDYYQLVGSSSCQDCLQILEADIEHANMLAASVPIGQGGACLHKELVYNTLATLFWFLLQWMDCSCTCLLPSYLNLFHIVVNKVCRGGKMMFTSHGRKATITEFYSVILPSL
ncbi:unnamed protein product [Ilex paraguariensis]|uniref:Uncharacterized protein n=1 Tax=Ilex paraguariensis TaxID=185542 RepID=A0ABC8TYG0_9AQUA